MQNQTSKLFLISGKIAAGKSTLAGKLATRKATVLISQDHWLTNLYPDEISTLDDYVRCSARLRDAINPHVVSLLHEGLSVVMDFPANTISQRQWLRGIFETADVAHELHYVDVSNEVCKMRLRDRNLAGEHPFQTSETEFDLFTSHFVAPTFDEGFNIIIHRS
jgi:predicted kinase